MALISTFIPDGPSGFGYSTTAEEITQNIDLKGKTYLVTGSNSGMGNETARVLSLRGARVIAAARTVEKAQAACGDFSSLVMPVACELSEPSSIRACINTIKQDAPKLDGIICNAGIMALPKLTKAHGYELQFFTNHMGHFILVTGLLDHLSDAGRVVMLSSAAHKSAFGMDLDNLTGEKGYSSWKSYAQSKLANLLFAKALAKRFEGTQQTANALHPGVIKTNLMRSNLFSEIGMTLINPIFNKTVQEGAATQCYVATHPSLAQVNGEYFADCNLAKHTKYAKDDALAEALWRVSEDIAAKV
ncbi:MAG: SDR family oxidoreductase [Pseudomonadota bacterium]